MSNAVADNRPDEGEPPHDAPAPNTTTTPPPEPPHDAVITDVWSWTARKYRIRARVLLLINLVLFCGVCAFSYWLHLAKPFDWSPASYIEPFRFWGPQTQNLQDFILFPISVDQRPVYGIVIGLLVAGIVAVPISVSIIYRFRYALPFIAAVFIFAHMPWMAFTLLISCVLAALRPFRMSFRFGSALLGMLPVLVYLFLATRGSGDPLSASISPERKLLLAGPWLLAILAACTMLGAVIAIARVVNYRPGAVAPVMAVMFATPALLFHVYVGVDELHYRLLEAEYGPRSERFAPVKDATDAIRAMLHDWTHPRTDRESLRAALLPLWSADVSEQNAFKHRIARRLLLELLADRRDAYEACKGFIADHPNSRYVPNVLFIQAHALDTRLDERALIGGNAQRELYPDFPHVESEPVWSTLLTEYGASSPLAVAARLRVGQLRLRQGDTPGAVTTLTLSPPETDQETALDREPAERPFLRTEPAESSLDFDPDDDRLEAQRLRELILANADDPLHGPQPLESLAALDPHRVGYRDQLQRLAHRYPDSLLYDNIVVRWASTATDREERAARLAACIERFTAGDALPEAMFELADLEVQAFGVEDEARRHEGLKRLRSIVSRFPDTCWATLATERLRDFEPSEPASSKPVVTP